MAFKVNTVKILKKFPSDDGSKWSRQLQIVDMGEEGKLQRFLTYARYYDEYFRGVISLDLDATKYILDNSAEILKLLGDK